MDTVCIYEMIEDKIYTEQFYTKKKRNTFTRYDDSNILSHETYSHICRIKKSEVKTLYDAAFTLKCYSVIIASPRPLFYPLFRKVNKNIENKRVHSDQLNFNELHRAFGEIRFQGNIPYIGSVDTQFLSLYRQ